MTGRLDSKADLVFRNLLSTMVENAQLAALEIADGVDPAQMPEMLEAIRMSVHPHRGDAGLSDLARVAWGEGLDPPECHLNLTWR